MAAAAVMVDARAPRALQVDEHRPGDVSTRLRHVVRRLHVLGGVGRKVTSGATLSWWHRYRATRRCEKSICFRAQSDAAAARSARHPPVALRPLLCVGSHTHARMPHMLLLTHVVSCSRSRRSMQLVCGEAARDYEAGVRVCDGCSERSEGLAAAAVARFGGQVSAATSRRGVVVASAAGDA